VIIAVLVNHNKKPLFSTEERVEMIEQSIKEYAINNKNIEIASFSGLLIDFLKQKNVKVVVKGLRVVTDFEYEFQMALLNKNLDDEIETMFMMTNYKYSYISSSMIKEVARLGGDIDQFVPENVKEKLLQKIEAGEN
jgi:pantetheine-phosphate adenylyltransferase